MYNHIITTIQLLLSGGGTQRLAGKEGMEENMDTNHNNNNIIERIQMVRIGGYIGTAVEIYAFIPC